MHTSNSYTVIRLAVFFFPCVTSNDWSAHDLDYGEFFTLDIFIAGIFTSEFNSSN